MSDQDQHTLHDGSWGGVPLHFLSTEDDNGRDVVVTMYPKADGGDAEDMGLRARVTSATLEFFPTAAAPDHYAAFMAFIDLVAIGEPQELIHPLTGTYSARVSAVSYSASAEARDLIRVSVTFIEATRATVWLESGAGVPVAAAEAAALASLSEMQVAAAAVGETVDEGFASAVADTLQEWATAADTTASTVTLQLNDLSNQLAAETDRLEAATDPDRFEIFRTSIRLGNNLRNAGMAMAMRSEQLVDVTAAAATSLLALSASLYGGAKAVTMAEEIARLNSIPNQARIEAGTTLRAPAAGKK